MLAVRTRDVPDSLRSRTPAQIIDMPVWASGDELVMAESGTQTTRAKRGADVNIEAWMDMKESEATDADAMSAGAREHQQIRSDGVRDHGTIVAWMGKTPAVQHDDRTNCERGIATVPHTLGGRGESGPLKRAHGLR